MAEPVPPGTPDGNRRPCPICGKSAVAAAAPFCSKRCADIDLHKWLKGVYVVPDDGAGGPDAAAADDEGP